MCQSCLLPVARQIRVQLDVNICLWDDAGETDAMEVRHQLPQTNSHEDWIRTLTLLPKATHDGVPRLASTAHDGSVRIWEMPKKQDF